MLSQSELPAIRGQAAALLGMPVSEPVAIRGGRNNQIFRVEAKGVSYAIKRYPPPTPDRNDRLATEYGALQFVLAQGLDCVPRPLARDDVARIAVYQWVAGHAVGRDDRPVDELAGFFASLQRGRSAASETPIGSASAACFSGADAVAQLRQRRSRLAPVQKTVPALDRFLMQRFDVAAEKVIQHARQAMGEGVFTETLPRTRQCLSPSDFGFHHALIGLDGRLVFLDFEYFGWDDPVKAVSDVMLHPGMELSAEEGRRYCSAIFPAIAEIDPDFEARFRAHYPVYGLIWCLIILNEFLPDVSGQRRAAGAIEGSVEAFRETQLAKAERLLDRVMDDDDRY